MLVTFDGEKNENNLKRIDKTEYLHASANIVVVIRLTVQKDALKLFYWKMKSILCVDWICWTLFRQKLTPQLRCLLDWKRSLTKYNSISNVKIETCALPPDVKFGYSLTCQTS